MPGMFDREYQSTRWHQVPMMGRPGHVRERPPTQPVALQDLWGRESTHCMRQKTAGWVSSRALSGRPLAGQNVTEKHHSSLALTHRLAQHGTRKRARISIQGGDQSPGRQIMAEHRDRHPSGLCRTRAMQVKLIHTRAHLVPRRLCCCYICAVGMFLMRWGLVMQVTTCSTHRLRGLMEVFNLGPKHRPVQ